MRRAWTGGSLAACLMAFAAPPSSAEPIPVATLKAEMVERFTQFVEWPDESLPGPGEPFVVCIAGGHFGTDPVALALEVLAVSRRIKDRAVRVRRLSRGDDVAGCHLLWVSVTESARLEEVLAQTRWRPILTVGDADGYALRGVAIVLRPAGKRIGFEINLDEATRGGLRISSRLLQLGTIVVTPPRTPERLP